MTVKGVERKTISAKNTEMIPRKNITRKKWKKNEETTNNKRKEGGPPAQFGSSKNDK